MKHGISHLLNRLCALGTPLLQRGISGSTLTAEGARIAVVSESLLAAWYSLSRASSDRFRKAAATARLGSVIPLGYESEIARLLANLTARWLAEHPRAPLFVSSTTADDLLAGLKSGLSMRPSSIPSIYRLISMAKW